jgi:hypothetical protein
MDPLFFLARHELVDGVHRVAEREEADEPGGRKEHQLEATYETFQQEHEHEQELAEAVDEAAAPEGLSPVYYKAAIAVLLLLLLVITGLWLGVV